MIVVKLLTNFALLQEITSLLDYIITTGHTTYKSITRTKCQYYFSFSFSRLYKFELSGTIQHVLLEIYSIHRQTFKTSQLGIHFFTFLVYFYNAGLLRTRIIRPKLERQSFPLGCRTGRKTQQARNDDIIIILVRRREYRSDGRRLYCGCSSDNWLFVFLPCVFFLFGASPRVDSNIMTSTLEGEMDGLRIPAIDIKNCETQEMRWINKC